LQAADPQATRCVEHDEGVNGIRGQEHPCGYGLADPGGADGLPAGGDGHIAGVVAEPQGAAERAAGVGYCDPVLLQ